jgi:SpoIID/LytB domain protein
MLHSLRLLGQLNMPFTWVFSQRLVGSTMMAIALLSASTAVGLTSEKKNQEVELQVGVVQRFGSDAKDTLSLQVPPGNRLTLKFQTDNKPQVVTATTARLEMVMQPLKQPQVDERVVLSTHRSFESAEESANRWRSQGIPVEVAQPERWQVWAKRDVYSSPLLRRLLLQSLQSQGFQTAYIDSKIRVKLPQAALVVNGNRYSRDRVEISASSPIQVKQGGRESNRHLYAGSLRLQPNAYGTYTLVNQVPIETYLRGVVPHEIGSAAAQAVLEVQAILARTYALRNLRRFAIDDYQLCADTQCQVYYGLEGTTAATDRAIAATRSLVLTYGNELVDAVYSSTTGGITAPFSDIWQGDNRPYLKAVLDSVAQSWDLSRKSLADETNFRRFIGQRKGFNEEGQTWFRWRSDSSLVQLNRELRQYLVSQKSPIAGFRTIQKLEVTRRSPAGRVQEVTVTTDQGSLSLQKDDILKVFEAPNSTLFYLEPVYGEKRVLKGYAFIGGGLGHGVGLSQTGSYHLGKLGWSSSQILNFYYPGTTLQPISDAIIFWRDR